MKVCSLIVLLIVSPASALAAPKEIRPSAIENASSNLPKRATPASALPQETGIILEPGKSAETDLSNGSRESYRILMTSGQYVRLGVTAHGIPLTATLLSPAGAPIFQRRIEDRQGAVAIHFVARDTGAYRVEVRTDEHSPSGNCQVTIDELRAATDQDKQRVRAQELLRQGEELRWKETADSLPQAIEFYKKALDLWIAADDLRGEADTRGCMGLVYHLQRNFSVALEQDRKALELWKLLGDMAGQAEMLRNSGRVNFDMGERQKARDLYVEALNISLSIKDANGQAHSLQSLGLAYRYLGEPQKALDCYIESLRLFRYLGDPGGEEATLGNLAVLYGYLGDSPKAVETFNQALLARHTADDTGKGWILDNLGKQYNVMGDKRKAVEYLNRGLKTRQESGDVDGEASSLNSIGLVYASLGDNDKALELFKKSLSLVRDAKDRPGESAVLFNIGRLYLDSASDKAALGFLNEALLLSREMSNFELVGQILQQIGRVHAHNKEWHQAIDLYNQAVATLKSAGSPRKQASALNDLGAVYASCGRVEDAYQTFTAALALSQAVMEPSTEAAALVGLARIELRRGKLLESRSHVEAALQIAENVRAKVAGQELRASYFASVQDYFRLHTDVLAQLHQAAPRAGYDVQAFEASERKHARGLLDLLSEAGVDIREGVDPQLLDRERDLGKRIAAKSEFQIRLLSGKHTEEQIAVVKKELDELIAQFQEIEAQIRANSPRYAALTQPQTLTAREIQTQILDADTALLEYALGEEHSCVWVVTQSSLEMVSLAGRVEIEEAAKRLYELFAVHDPEREEQRLAANRNLSELLLRPIAEHLRTKRLVIVGDGALQYLPFEALLKPGSQGEAPRPLILDHEIVTTPSASILSAVRHERKDRSPASKTLAVLADPVFASNDPRVHASENIAKREVVAADTTTSSSIDEKLQRSAKESGVLSFDRLPSSRREAEEILALAGKDREIKAVDFEASRETALSAQLADYRIVHFASHSLLNVQHPDLSGIVLSLVDKDGRPQDGFLRLQDVYNLKWRADLVVLSACKTALGTDVKGEGLLGLTRGFMYAGAPTVVASLWKVSDKATSELMKEFYRAMLAQGLRPAAALRAAQLEIMKDKRWADPYYWAGFTVQGEW